MYRNFIVRSDACGCRTFINCAIENISTLTMNDAFDRIEHKTKNGETVLIVVDYTDNDVFYSFNMYNLSECNQEFLLRLHYEYLITITKHGKEDYTLSMMASEKIVNRLANRERFKLEEKINPVLRGYVESVKFDLGKTTPKINSFFFEAHVLRNDEEGKILVDVVKYNHFKEPNKKKVYGCTVFNANVKSQAEITSEIYSFLKDHDFYIEHGEQY